MEIQLRLYGTSKLLSDSETLLIQLPENSNVEKLRNTLTKIISEKHLKSNLTGLSKTAAFFSEIMKLFAFSEEIFPSSVLTSAV